MANLRIIFIGTPEFGAIILEKLVQAKYRPVLVITAPDKPVGRKQILTPPPVKLTAQKYSLNIIQPPEIQNSKFKIQNSQPDMVVVTAYGQIIPQEILDIPKYGCLNVHPSLLPKYRGASPIQTAILNGDEKTGVTIMLMDEKMDHGQILAQGELEFSAQGGPSSGWQFLKLRDELAELGAKLLINTIPKYINNEIKPKEQDHSQATFTKIIKKEDGQIDWNEKPEEIERMIRAYNPWPGTFTFVKKNDKSIRVKILEVKIKNNNLVIKKVQPENKKEMSYNDFLLTYPNLC